MAKITEIQYNRIKSRMEELLADVEMYQAQKLQAGTSDLRENEGYHAANEGIKLCNQQYEVLSDLISKSDIIPISTGKTFDLGSLILIQFGGEENHLSNLTLDSEYVKKSVQSIKSYKGSMSDLWNLEEYDEEYVASHPELVFNDSSLSTRMFLIDEYGDITSGVLDMTSPLVKQLLNKPDNIISVEVPIPSGALSRIFVKKLPKAFEERFKVEYPINSKFI